MGNELIGRDVDAMTWAVIKEQAIMLVKSGFLPKAIDTPEKAMAVAIKGRELGLPMMQSIASINVIDGKPAISAELMAALVHQKIPNAILRCVETSNQICTYEAGRPADKILRMSFTWQDAVTAGVTGKNNWKQYPAAMLRARCCSAICRIVFPDAIMGCYTPDELGAITTEEGDITGEVINISTQKPPITPPQAKKAETQQQIIVNVISEPQRKRLFAISKKAGITDEEMKVFLAGYGFTSSKLITKDKYEEICTRAENSDISTVNIPECTENPATCELSTWDDKQIPYCGDSGDVGGGLICKYKVENA